MQNGERKKAHRVSSFHFAGSLTVLIEWVKKEAVFLGGFSFFVVLSIVFLVAGEDIPALIHDCLDLEVSRILVQLKHIGSNSFPEFMDGAWNASSSLSPGSALFYMWLEPVTAFALNTIFVLFAAYIGCWLFLEAVGVRPWVSSFAAFSFALLPFYSVFGLSVMGIPVLGYGTLQMLRRGRAWFVGLILTALYGCFSSVTTVGFAVMLLLAVLFVAMLFMRQWGSAALLFTQLVLLGVIYLLFDASLVSQMLGAGSAPTGHRIEFVLPENAFSLNAVFVFFLSGHYHAASNQFWIVVFDAIAMVVIGLWLLKHRRKASELRSWLQTRFGWLLGIVVLCFAIAVLYEIYHSWVGTSFRVHLPESLRSLQIDRLYWLYPALWYVSFGVAAEGLVRICAGHSARMIASILVALTAGLSLSLSATGNIMMQNLRTFVIPEEPDYITWRQFFDEETFAKIEEDLSALSGDKENYRVASMGLYPAIALYNGFYCLDGYSNYYDVAYKHRFREIIAEELEADPRLKSYYDDWGNRVYLFSHELGIEFMVSDDDSEAIRDLKLDLDAFREMGGEYIFSAVPIVDPEQYGLCLVGDYAQEDSYYTVHVYGMI